MKEITNDWLISAKDDLAIIKKIADDNTLSNMIAFHCQQSIEKCFKAVIEEYEIGFIKTHDLELLYNNVKHYIKKEIDIIQLKKIDELYITARYPGELGLLPNGKPSLEEVNIFVEIAEDLYHYLLRFL